MTKGSKSIFANRFAKLVRRALNWFHWGIVTKRRRVLESRDSEYVSRGQQNGGGSRSFHVKTI